MSSEVIWGEAGGQIFCSNERKLLFSLALVYIKVEVQVVIAALSPLLEIYSQEHSFSPLFSINTTIT